MHDKPHTGIHLIGPTPDLMGAITLASRELPVARAQRAFDALWRCVQPGRIHRYLLTFMKAGLMEDEIEIAGGDITTVREAVAGA